TNHAKKGVGAACGPLAADGGGHVFFADGGCLPSGLGRIDVATNASVEYPESGTVWGLATGLGSVWISGGGEGGGEWSSFVARVDPATGAILGKTATGNQTGYGDVQVDTARGLVYASTFSGVILVLKPCRSSDGRWLLPPPMVRCRSRLARTDTRFARDSTRGPQQARVDCPDCGLL